MTTDGTYYRITQSENFWLCWKFGFSGKKKQKKTKTFLLNISVTLEGAVTKV